MSNITPGHVRAFQMVQSQLYDNVNLMSCTISGEPGVAIVMFNHAGEGKIGVMPLFVALTASMKLDFPEFESADDETPSQSHGNVRVANSPSRAWPR